MTRQATAIFAATMVLLTWSPRQVAAATLQPETLAAWTAYVAATEARITSELSQTSGFLTTDFSAGNEPIRSIVRNGGIPVSSMRTRNRNGSAIDIPDGLISHWRGTVFLPGVRLETLLDRLQDPSQAGPHQEDVLALRVLERGDDRLKLYIRMTRTKVVTATYDTEHQVTYRLHSPSRVTSSSVATRIAELDGAGTAQEFAKPEGRDRGFLWRMNSYWRYEQVPGGVIVELESLTLSRSLPIGLSMVAQPIIDRVAHESMTRTLDNLRKVYAAPKMASVGARH